MRQDCTDKHLCKIRPVAGQRLLGGSPHFGRPWRHAARHCMLCSRQVAIHGRRSWLSQPCSFARFLAASRSSSGAKKALPLLVFTHCSNNRPPKCQRRKPRVCAKSGHASGPHQHAAHGGLTEASVCQLPHRACEHVQPHCVRHIWSPPGHGAARAAGVLQKRAEPAVCHKRELVCVSQCSRMRQDQTCDRAREHLKDKAWQHLMLLSLMLLVSALPTCHVRLLASSCPTSHC